MTEAYDPSLTLREARALYFERNGIPEDGGYAKRWVKVTRNRLPLYLLNTAPRRRAVPYHDIHHVLTGYDTSNTGESEISAWELAAGTSPHWISLFLDLAGMAIGLFIAPRRTFRAFVRGRCSRSLYAAPLGDDLLATSVGKLREQLGIVPEAARPKTSDFIAFVMFSAAGVITAVSLVVFAPIFVLIGLFMQ